MRMYGDRVVVVEEDLAFLIKGLTSFKLRQLTAR